MPGNRRHQHLPLQPKARSHYRAVESVDVANLDRLRSAENGGIYDRASDNQRLRGIPFWNGAQSVVAVFVRMSEKGKSIRCSEGVIEDNTNLQEPGGCYGPTTMVNIYMVVGVAVLYVF